MYSIFLTGTRDQNSIDKDHARYYAYWMGVLETGGEIVVAGREVNELVKINGGWLISIRDVNPGK